MTRSVLRSTAGIFGMLIAATQLLAAQESTAPATSATTSAPERRWEIRFTSGGLFNAGTQRNYLKDAQTSAAQLSFLVRPTVAVTGTLSWARSRDLGTIDTPKLDIFTSDLGVELRPAAWFAGHAVTFSPFAGVGAGVRSYNYRTLDVNATYNVAGYGAIGGEIGVGRVGVRIEVRDYASGFKPLMGSGKSATRNDIMLTVALRFNRRPNTTQR
jgi:hypothetical protein